MPAGTTLPGTTMGQSSAPGQISFIDADAFDVSLQNAMTQQLPTIEVLPTAAIGLNSLPPRLSRWLTAVARSNGQVTLEPGMKTQASVVVDLLGEAYNQIQQNMMYQAAAGYNAVIYQQQGAGSVEKILFTAKPGGGVLTTPAPAPAQ